MQAAPPFRRKSNGVGDEFIVHPNLLHAHTMASRAESKDLRFVLAASAVSQLHRLRVSVREALKTLLF
jgi:hypothetical protein